MDPITRDEPRDPARTMAIAIVGRGRLGRSLSALLARTGAPAAIGSHRDPVPPGRDAVLLCVPDAAVRAVSDAVPPGPVVIHCSGALELDVLDAHPPERRASLHPLMTFPGPEVALPDLAGVPAAIAGDPAAAAVAAAIATRLGLAPFSVPGDRRLYHAAAVMAGNFATLLLAEASQALAAAGIPADRAAGLLAPLAVASIRNAAAAADPRQALTGPIARGDAATLDAHRAALRDHHLDEVLSLYDTLAKHAAAWRRLPERGGPHDP